MAGFKLSCDYCGEKSPIKSIEQFKDMQNEKSDAKFTIKTYDQKYRDNVIKMLYELLEVSETEKTKSIIALIIDQVNKLSYEIKCSKCGNKVIDKPVKV